MRAQAARHSALLMCVCASQKPMHAGTPCPPPPGALAAVSLGLGDPPALLGVLVAVATCAGSWGESGAMAGCCGMGAAICDAGVAADAAWDAVAAEPPPPPPPPELVVPPDVPFDAVELGDADADVVDMAAGARVLKLAPEWIAAPWPPPRAKAGGPRTRGAIAAIRTAIEPDVLTANTPGLR
jgi:hypothetical protein